MIANIDHEFHAQVARRAIDGMSEALRAAQGQLSADPANSDRDRQLREILGANAHLLAGAPATHSCGGSFSWAAAVIWGTLNTTPTLDFAGWGSLVFSGTHWGLGAGAGISYTVGFSVVPPQEVIGEVEYGLSFSGAIVTLSFMRAGRLLLSVAGPALNVGAGGFYGTGTFRRA